MAQKVALVEKGIFKGYLHSRESAGHFKTKSNGHARASQSGAPCPRMSNIVIKSENEGSFDELKEKYFRLCKEQGKPYGLHLKRAMGGESMPADSAFKEIPVHIFRLYPDGREERVRGIYAVGTARQTLENIMMTSDNYQVCKGYCTAESGRIPASEVAPDALVKSLEFNRLPREFYKKKKINALRKPRINS